jgi:hypothetical protein
VEKVFIKALAKILNGGSSANLLKSRRNFSGIFATCMI